MARLAIGGGSPVWREAWPLWPQHDARTSERVIAALGSGRWTVSGGWTGTQPYEQVFARRFAEFVEVPYCVSTDHGSSSLMIALEALGVGAGDEVIVPVLTWVATATAVLNVNAVPVFVDVDPETGCLDPRALSAAVTARTRAVIVVHLHCRMADMDEIGALATQHGLPVIEDCAQAHGARWAGRPAGSLGDVGAFSMQQGKVLTCGEGGAVVTKDAALYDRLQQLRADARRYPAAEPDIGYPYLVEAGEVMGTNHCLAELPAALLLDQLERLPQQLLQRARAAELLDTELAGVAGVRPTAWPARLELPASSPTPCAATRTPSLARPPSGCAPRWRPNSACACTGPIGHCTTTSCTARRPRNATGGCMTDCARRRSNASLRPRRSTRT